MTFVQVRIVVSKKSGTEYACKSIQKRLDIANVSLQRQAAHLENIDREIKVLKKLRGALDVVNFKGAYEDDTFIHIVMEYCRGGELLHHISSTPHYTERTVIAHKKSKHRLVGGSQTNRGQDTGLIQKHSTLEVEGSVRSFEKMCALLALQWCMLT